MVAILSRPLCVNNKLALVRVITSHLTEEKPLNETMVTQFKRVASSQ